MGKDKKCPTCKLNPAVYKLVVEALKLVLDRRACPCSHEKQCLGHQALAAAQGETT